MRELHLRTNLHELRMRCIAKCGGVAKYNAAMRISARLDALLGLSLQSPLYAHVRGDVLGKWYLAGVERGLK